MSLADDVSERAAKITETDEYKNRFAELLDEHGGLGEVEMDEFVDTLTQEFVHENDTIPDATPAPAMELIVATFKRRTHEHYLQTYKDTIEEADPEFHDRLVEEGQFDRIMD